MALNHVAARLRLGRSTRPRKQVRAVVVVVAGIAALLAGCSSSDDSNDSKGGKPVLTIGVAAPPRSLDPAQDAGAWQFIRPLTNATLVNEMPDGKLEPWLATKWGYADDDHKVFELTLREDAKFSDGTPVNAEAIKTSLEYFKNLGKSSFIGDMGQLSSIEVVDEYTVRLNFDEPNLVLPYKLAQHDSNWGAVQSPKAIARPDVLATGTFGAGPYKVDEAETVVGQTYTLVPNQYYFDNSAQRWSKVVVKVIPQASTMLQSLQAGEIDVAYGDASTQEAAAKIPNVKVLGAPSQAAGINLQNRVDGPLSDVRVRQALNYAIDRETITKTIVGGIATPSSSVMSSDAMTDEATNYYDYDVEKAKQLVAEAGYADGFTLKYGGTSYTQLGAPLAQAIASYWQKIGVKVEITPLADPVAFTNYILAKDFDVNQLVVSVGPFQFNYWSGMRPGGGTRNIFNASDPDMDALWQEATQAEDPQPVFQQMNLLSVEKAYFVPVMLAPQYYYVRTDRVSGVNVPEARQSLPWATEWSPA